MITGPNNNFDFKAWREIEPPSDFTQNVMRRVRTQPVREPSWRESLAAFFASRATFGGVLALSLIVALVALREPGVPKHRLTLEPNSLIVAYAKLAGGN